MAHADETWLARLQKYEVAHLLQLPNGLPERTWAPAMPDREAAWALYSELRTRITTQPLDYRSGDEATALESFHSLFATTRTTLHKYPLCSEFGMLVDLMLNQVIRPFTARWHKRLVEGRFQTDDGRHDFRRELAEQRDKLRKFMGLFGEMAEGPGLLPMTTNKTENPDREGTANLGNPIAFHIISETPPIGTEELEKAEKNYILQRRRLLQRPVEDAQNVTGLALSGGGIRSATFALGVLQQLSSRGILGDFDYLSTVSGGGYLGAFLSVYLDDQDAAVGARPQQLPFVGPQADPRNPPRESAPLRHLRNRSKSLIEPTLIARLQMVGQALWGMTMALLAVFPLIALAAVVTHILWLLVPSLRSGMLLLEIALIAWATLLFAVPICDLLVRWVGVQSRWQWWRSKLTAVSFAVLLVALAAIVAAALVAGYGIYTQATQLFSATWLALAAVILPVLLVALSLVVPRSRLFGKILIVLASVAGPVMLLLLAYSLTAWIAAVSVIYWLPAIAVATLYALLFVDVNRISPHVYYRQQLAKTYLVRRGPADAGAGVLHVERQLLSALGRTPKAPYSLINAAVNLPSSLNRNLRGRRSDFFLFSKYFCGSPTTGYVGTENLEQMDGHLDLATAVAISGAAVSPQMGVVGLRRLSFWLSILNVRLGYWIPNAAARDARRWTRIFAPGALYLIRECFGLVDEKSSYLNLSDGGHIENLGIYELLRRRCKVIVAIDGEADPDLRFDGLMKVLRYAAIDLGITVRIDLEDLRLMPSGYHRGHFALGEVEYGSGDKGYLLYVKLSLTGNEENSILDYRRQHRLFPHEPTTEQLFGEAQFEAYRALGHHIGGELFREELVGTEPPQNAMDWLGRLAARLLDEPHRPDTNQ